ncbi:hypothetical protein IWX90DRAFT_307703 [Phyllosticta citrichinensis]|uniref:Uncharacterized protein n=1 Tax=Phyllosticta citrichinensis TaxID=1130410 RepID=A0ABR1XLY5_9PEZI
MCPRLPCYPRPLYYRISPLQILSRLLSILASLVTRALALNRCALLVSRLIGQSQMCHSIDNGRSTKQFKKLHLQCSPRLGQLPQRSSHPKVIFQLASELSTRTGIRDLPLMATALPSPTNRRYLPRFVPRAPVVQLESCMKLGTASSTWWFSSPRHVTPKCDTLAWGT